MLVQKDLKWNYKTFNFQSALGLFPVTFKPVLLGGEMESEESSIWRRIAFKSWQILFASESLFISVRTLDYVTGGVFFGGDGELDWDIVPLMLTLR